jgi:hypothetical protein
MVLPSHVVGPTPRWNDHCRRLGLKNQRFGAKAPLPLPGVVRLRRFESNVPILKRFGQCGELGFGLIDDRSPAFVEEPLLGKHDAIGAIAHVVSIWHREDPTKLANGGLCEADAVVSATDVCIAAQ